MINDQGMTSVPATNSNNNNKKTKEKKKTKPNKPEHTCEEKAQYLTGQFWYSTDTKHKKHSA